MNMKMLAMLLAATSIASGAQAQGWETSFDGGLFATDRFSTDTEIEGSPFLGTYLGGYAGTRFGSLKFAIDGRAEFTDDRGADDVDETGPLHTAVLGARLGSQFANTYFGAFVGAGWFDGYDSEDPMRGDIYGVEVEHFLSNGASVYAQLGHVRAIGDPGDNEFIGYDAKIGYLTPVGPRTTLNFSLEQAYSSECFEDCGGDWGRYVALGVEANYKLSERVDLVGAINYATIFANTEDWGSEANLYLGVRVPFGARPTSALRTPMGGFHAAGWMEPLD
ncbi:MAG: hypothetical protein K0B00_06565 [Rhodobacteraceae bacterium]|nr:hypothetical protein [Paracoccaceae bacterium]